MENKPKIIDANAVQQLPPNYQKVSVAHASLSGCNINAAISVKAVVRKYGFKNFTLDTEFSSGGWCINMDLRTSRLILSVTPILATDPQAS